MTVNCFYSPDCKLLRAGLRYDTAHDHLVFSNGIEKLSLCIKLSIDREFGAINRLNL